MTNVFGHELDQNNNSAIQAKLFNNKCTFVSLGFSRKCHSVPDNLEFAVGYLI